MPFAAGQVGTGEEEAEAEEVVLTIVVLLEELWMELELFKETTLSIESASCYIWRFTKYVYSSYLEVADEDGELIVEPAQLVVVPLTKSFEISLRNDASSRSPSYYSRSRWM